MNIIYVSGVTLTPNLPIIDKIVFGGLLPSFHAH